MCDTCLKARDEELRRLRESLIRKIEGKRKLRHTDYQPECGDCRYNQALDDLLSELKKE